MVSVAENPRLTLRARSSILGAQKSASQVIMYSNKKKYIRIKFKTFKIYTILIFYF